MLGVSSSTWAWMGALAPVLWFARTVIWAFLVDRITKSVIEKADVKDLPEILTGLGVLTGVLLSPRGRAGAEESSARRESATDDAEKREGDPVE